jgi:SAM-dependent methyltransferase
MKHNRASVPRAGQTFGRRADELSRPIREAVEIISSVFRRDQRVQEAFLTSFAPRYASEFQPSVFQQDVGRRAAWLLINSWILYAVTNKSSVPTFEETETWFFEEHRLTHGLARFLTPSFASEVLLILGQLSLDQEFQDLLPYVLEPFGAGSRFSVMQDKSTQSARNSKRSFGVYYTPHDVASYMASEVVRRYGSDWIAARCLDPACGSGIFLLALAEQSGLEGDKHALLRWISEHLYGVDVSPLSIESSVFVLLHYVLRQQGELNLSPFAAWHLLRVNFGALDAIRLRRHVNEDQGNDRSISAVRACLRQGVIPEASKAPTTVAQTIRLSAIFPNLSCGSGIVIGNPPYGDIGGRDELLELSRDFRTFRTRAASPGDDIHLFFIEMMWSLSDPARFSSSMVVPLSVGFSRGTSFGGSRVAMMEVGCDWRFAFFDREPHALFGEDVKTRNIVLFAHSAGLHPAGPAQRPKIGTTKLLRWTSRNRAELFSKIGFTLIPNIDIARGIPKLEGAVQAKMYWTLRGRQRSLAYSIRRSSIVRLSDIINGNLDQAALLVGSTAYNFINVFFAPGLCFPEGARVSGNGLHLLQFASREHSLAAYAILASRLVHWLWTVEGDGFHVPLWFLKELPVCLEDFSSADLTALATFGTALWTKTQEDVVRSVNKGKHSLAFRPVSFVVARDRIDVLICGVLGLPPEAAGELHSFTEDHILVDRADTSRVARLQSKTEYLKLL